MEVSTDWLMIWFIEVLYIAFEFATSGQPAGFDEAALL